jgi:hypothetical protein
VVDDSFCGDRGYRNRLGDDDIVSLWIVEVCLRGLVCGLQLLVKRHEAY